MAAQAVGRTDEVAVMAMNADEISKRRVNVKARIAQLRSEEKQARADKHWYSSRAFQRQVQNNRSDRLQPVLSSEQYRQWLGGNQRRAQVEDLLAAVNDLPSTAGTRVLTPHPARVAMVADTFLYETYEGTARVSYVTPDNFRGLARDVDVLIVTSTWRGRFDEWHSIFAPAGLLRSEVIPAFRSHGVPVVFYSKEDPPNYGRFRSLATEADAVFTSAREKISDYAAACPRAQSVDSLTFGVNPLIHTPIGSRRHRAPEVLFAGSWLSHKYAARQKAARRIFDGVLDAGRDLLIIDRNAALGDPNYFYPREYMDHVGPGVGHLELMKLQRAVDVQLNLNSVTDSATMYANRVVELQAMGSFVLSNYSLAVNDLYPEVQLVDRSEEIPLILDNMTGDRLYRAQNDGLRRVWEHDTAWQRMREMLLAVGAPTRTLSERVAVVPEHDTLVGEAAKVAASQTVHTDVLAPHEVRSRVADYDVIVPVSNTHEYSATHVRDLLNVFRFADVDIAAKNGEELDGRIISRDDHEIVDGAFSSARAALRTDAAGGVLETWIATGRAAGRTYSTAPFGAGRKSAESIRLSTHKPPQLSVVVPVYNNGKHLVSKCFRSLERSTIFDEMEILLIDDGSTDRETVQTVRELAARHPNVRAHLFETGGSGSASRPRNEGLKLASAPYITYLDPDNEALNDGYQTLLKTVGDLRVQFAIGDMVKLAATRRYVSNTKLLEQHLPADPTGGLQVPDDALERIRFQPMSIQALVADTEWLRSIGLYQPVGALGQDSLAFQQMLYGARRIATVRRPIHVYYGAVSNSMINTVGPGFYGKYLVLEEYRKTWLESAGLLETYSTLRADPFFRGWLVAKFNQFVSQEDKPEAREYLDALCAIYGVTLEPADPDLPDSPLQVRMRQTA